MNSILLRKSTLLFLMATLITYSCTNNDDKADGYGSFEATEISVAAETSGRIMQIGISEGMNVDSGSIALIVDSTEWSLKRLQLMAQYQAVNARGSQIFSSIEVQEQQLRNLTKEKSRIERLLKEGAASTKQLDDINGSMLLVNKQIESIKTQNAQLSFEAEALKKQIEQTELAISKCKIQNPLSGKVLSCFVNQGELAVPGKILYKLADMNTMYLRVYLSGKQLAGIKTGQQVSVQLESEQKELKTLPGEISWISDQSEFTPKIIQTREERVNLVYAVKIKVKNDGYIRIGMPGEVILKAFNQ